MSRIVRLSLPTPFPVGPVNVYLVPGAVPTLVDTGLDLGDNRDHLAAAIDAHLGGRLAQVLLTHGHIDHAGLAGWLQSTYGALVHVHAGDRQSVEEGHDVDRRVERGDRAHFIRAGFPVDRFDRATRRFNKLVRCWTPVTVDGELVAGQPVDVGDESWQVSHHPGHARGQVCLRAPDGTGLAGDLLIRGLSTIAFFDKGDPADGLGLERHIASLEAFAADPPRRVGAGHREWIEDPPAELRRGLADIAARLDEVAALLTDTPRSPWDVARELFEEPAGDQAWLATAEVLGVLEVLERRGRAAQQGGGEGLAYVAAAP